MAEGSITGRQMKRLQTLWGLFARQAHLDAKDRDARLGWFAGAIGRPISSFKDMSKTEAEAAIGAVEKYLPAELLRRNRPSRRTAHAYGTAGRHGSEDKEVRLVDAATLELLVLLRNSLGWTQERLDAFLLSPKSPLRQNRAIRTLADANKVIWALKRLLRPKPLRPPENRERTDVA